MSPTPNVDDRRNKRFRHRTRLSVVFAGDKRALDAVTVNVSRGGLLIDTERDVPAGHPVDVMLLDTALCLPLGAKVVHAQVGARKGVGVAFDPISDADSGYFEAFVRGVEATSPPDGDPRVAERRYGGSESPLRAFLDAFDRGELYQALGVDVDAPLAELTRAVRAFEECIAKEESARAGTARTALIKIRRTLLDAEQRLAHDLRAGLADLDALVARPPLSEREMRKAWALAFPSKAVEAKGLTDDAQTAMRNGALGKALRLAEEALERDPFNARLRSAARHWKDRVG